MYKQQLFSWWKTLKLSLSLICTSCEGSDLSGGKMGGIYKSLNPHFLQRKWHSSDVGRGSLNIFQSTLPAKEVTAAQQEMNAYKAISIHTSREGSDDCLI